MIICVEINIERAEDADGNELPDDVRARLYETAGAEIAGGIRDALDGLDWILSHPDDDHVEVFATIDFGTPFVQPDELSDPFSETDPPSTPSA
jgi:hypothetical protein